MEAHEISEKIHGHGHGHGGGEHAHGDGDFRKWCGIYLGVVAMLLAITTLGGSNATKLMLSANIHASDTYAFYQAKYIRQTEYQIAADQLETMIAPPSTISGDARTKVEETIRRYRETAARYETDPKAGNGKRELLAKAQDWEAQRDKAGERDPNFEFAEALFQIAIVLGSVAIVAVSVPLVSLSGILAALGTLLMLNGYLLIVHLPGH